jgi:hypothetical protein
MCRTNQEGKRSGFNKLVGAGDGNRTHVRSLGSFYTAIVRRPLYFVILLTTSLTYNPIVR